MWLYFRFSLSFRDIEEMLAERGVVVSYESVREWCLKLVLPTPSGFVRTVHAPATDGISMKSFLRFRASCSIYGGPSIRTAMCSTSSFSRGGINGPPRSSFASY